MLSFLPNDEGFLPKWQLFIALVATLNSLQNLATVSITRKLYTNKPQQGTSRHMGASSGLRF